MRTNQVRLRVHGGVTGYWTAEVLFDRTGTPYLASGWRRFCHKHEIEAGHFVVFNYDGDHTLTVTVFNDAMCRRHYVAPARGKADAASSSEDKSSHGLLFILVLGHVSDRVCNYVYIVSNRAIQC
jgi:hypothetical protein